MSMRLNKFLNHSILVYFLLLAFTGCNSKVDVVQVKNTGPTQGTQYNISYVVSEEINYQRQIDSILFAIDKSMSLWSEYSAISRLNAGDTLKRDVYFDHLVKVLEESIRISRKSNGYFDVSIAPLSNYWGFGPGKKTVIDSAKVDSLKSFVNYTKLHTALDSGYLPKGMKIDLNAIAQGYSVDVIAEFLENKGIENFLVEVGGELRARGKNIDERIWTVGVDKPKERLTEENRFQVILELDKLSIATSGNYRKFWVDEETGVKYVHTINPETGFPVKSNLLSVTIVCEEAITADGWATACMAAGLDRAKDFISNADENLEAYFVYTDKEGNWQIWQTPGFEKLIK